MAWHGKFCAQNSLSAPTQLFQECWSGPPPCRFGQILAVWVELVWTTHPPPKMQIWTDLGLCGNWCVDTNRCTPKDTVSFDSLPQATLCFCDYIVLNLMNCNTELSIIADNGINGGSTLRLLIQVSYIVS